ncbi:MAG TPA: L-seryl-tRNA(Sec) selenium transferase [Vicinamibacterales bacterium]|nr:L-seryl-tRNA(Sec) selenium transferase [Vicinamibacterales bacterium]
MTLRSIPSIDVLRRRERVRILEAEYGHAAVVEALRGAAADLRDRLTSGDAPADPAGAIEEALPGRLRDSLGFSLRRVLNATGVVIHTNLGRAPLAASAVDRVRQIASGYSNLEYDLGAGSRGRRDAHAERLLCRLTGAEAAVIVNNNAAATLLALAALAAGREVLISRGELVEIGGGFRVPDVMAQSGALLREVGTTNRTRVADYGAALSDRTALILRVHPSNFRVEGFTERPTLEALVELGRRFRIPVAEDLGSGLLRPVDAAALREEPTVAASVRAGANLVMFSGDKLLGGPQCGVLAGTTSALEPVRRHPLMRALRADKMTYAALEATLVEYGAERAHRTVPVQRMIAAGLDDVGRRAASLVAALGSEDVGADVVEGVSAVGGGSAPGSELPTRLVALHPGTRSPDALLARLRTQDPPVIGRIDLDRVVLDLRTIDPGDDALLARLVAAAAGDR